MKTTAHLIAAAMLASCAVANAALDGPVKEGGKTFAIRQGPTELARFTATTVTVNGVTRPETWQEVHVRCKNAARERTLNPGTLSERFEIRSGSGSVLGTATTLDLCFASVISRLTADGQTRISGGNVNSCVAHASYSTSFQPPTCVATFNYIASYTDGTVEPTPLDPEPCPNCPPPTVVCPTAPPAITVTQQCPDGTFNEDGWDQIIRVNIGPTPLCAVSITRTPAAPPTTVCVPIPVGAARLDWSPAVTNTDGSYISVGLGGYRIHYGMNQGELVNTIQINNPLQIQYLFRLPSAMPRGTYYFAVREFTVGGNDSAHSVIRSKVLQ